MVILEASYLGIKIITTKNKGTEQILKFDYKYFLRDISPLEIADLIKDASLNQDYFDLIKSSQRNIIKGLFDCKISNNSFIDLIEEE